MGREQAERTVWQFTAAAMATGAIPVPAVSAAIIAENTAMVAVIGSDMGQRVTMAAVVSSFGIVGALNSIGRAVFVEAARAMGWFAGPAGVGGVMALGAATAGLQTWAIGHLAIAVAENGGLALPAAQGRAVVAEAKETFDADAFRSRSEGVRARSSPQDPGWASLRGR